MKKKILTMLIGSCLILSLIPSAAFAETEPAAAEKLKEKLDEAAELIHGKEMETELYERADGSYVGTEVYDLGDGAQLIVEVTDTAEDGEQAQNILMPTSSGSSDLWRDFGNRSFTAKATVKYGGKSVTLLSTSNYTLSSDGIDLRSIVSSFETQKVSVSRGKTKITDSAARTPGASDVNGSCNFILSQVGSVKAEYQMNSTVGYVALDKAGKRIKVRQSWSLSKL